MTAKTVRHIYRMKPAPKLGHWLIRCDCGWSAQVPDRRWRPGERDKTLHGTFLAHIPEAEREVYILVDMRVVDEADPETGSPETVNGVFIMPAGIPCRQIQWIESDGNFYSKVQPFRPLSPIVTLPVGEVRTRDGKVFRLEVTAPGFAATTQP